MIVFVPDDCVDCPHAVHDGPCPGDPFDVPDSGPGGIEPHVPSGCPCGNPEFEPVEIAVADQDVSTIFAGFTLVDDPDEERLRDED